MRQRAEAVKAGPNLFGPPRRGCLDGRARCRTLAADRSSCSARPSLGARWKCVHSLAFDPPIRASAILRRPASALLLVVALDRLQVLDRREVVGERRRAFLPARREAAREDLLEI